MPRSFTASVLYNESSMREMDKVLQNSFYFYKKIILLAVTFIFLGIGIRLTADNTWGILLVIAGCLIAPYATFYTAPSQYVITSMDTLKGNPFTMSYEISNDNIICIVNGKKTAAYRYDMISRLIRPDKSNYVYLCVSKHQAIMIDTETLKPKNKSGFYDYIESHVGLEWTKPSSWTTFSFKTLKHNRQNTRMTYRMR